MKADPVNRILAKLVDVFIVLIAAQVAGFPGTLAGVLYLLISDGLFEGQSLGKKLIGLETKLVDEKSKHSVCQFKDSLIRNFPFAGLLLMSAIPVLGLLFSLLFVIYTALELYFVLKDDRGIRIGDIYASTQVVDLKK